MISIIENESPKLKVCKMMCDGGLHEKLNNYELTSFLNGHSTTLMIGKPKSGKTSLLYSFLKSKEILRNVFDKVFLFQPSASRESMKDKIFESLPEDQKFEELSLDNLMEVQGSLDGNSLIIFDDMTAYLKNKEVEKKLRELVFNRRHLHLSIIFLVQSWVSVPPQIRRIFNNIFIFKTSKNEMEKIWEEVVEQHKDLVLPIMKIVFNEPHSYLFINTDSQRLFRKFDEIVIT
jgi:hypothetical protein